MDNLIEELGQVEAELVCVEEEIQELLTRQSSLIERKDQLHSLIAEDDTEKKEKDTKVWEGTDFTWTDDLDRKLQEVFKLQDLRPMQRQTMNATLAKEDTLLIMPTGGGKSLCFQLPALVDKGLTLVVSPLVSLMEDQQMALEQLGVPSAMLNAATSKEDLKFVQDEMVSVQARLKLLYVTPEKLAKSKRFMNRLEKCYSIGNLARIVIDEVHCCSQWGHDFRPDYKFLGIMKRQFPNAPILGLTATATAAVLDDVKKILNIPRAVLFKASFNRPNLFYEVRPKPSSQKETMDEIYQLICRRFNNQSGIVYCFSRKETEEVASDLMSKGVKAGCYHADMDAQSRSRVHRYWLSGKIQVVVATVAFGMGIDKPDVRFVIHHSISKSMENLYQESGRAGRDEKRADCIVLYRFADVARQSSMVFTEQTGLQNLHGIVKYCIDTARCRRSVLASHFGEVWESSDCSKMCDNCETNSKRGTPKAREVTKYCQDVITLLDAAAATEQRVTSAKVVDAWYGRGQSTLKVKSVSIPPVDRDTAEKILAHMLVQGYIREDFHFTAYSTICYIVAGGKARLLRNNASKVYMDFRGKSDPAATPSSKSPKNPKQTSTTISGSSSTQPCSSETQPGNRKHSTPSATPSNKTKPKPLAVVSHKPSTAKSSTLIAASNSHSKEKIIENEQTPLSLTNGQGNPGNEEKRRPNKSKAHNSSPSAASKKDCPLKANTSAPSDSSSKLNTRDKDKNRDNNKDKTGGREQKSCVKTSTSASSFSMNGEDGEQKELKHTNTESVIKRQFVLSDDFDEDEDFDIKRPRKSQKHGGASIIISDDSDCGDEV